MGAIGRMLGIIGWCRPRCICISQSMHLCGSRISKVLFLLGDVLVPWTCACCGFFFVSRGEEGDADGPFL